MKFQQIRSATAIVTFGGIRFLIDPWLAPKDACPPIPGSANPKYFDLEAAFKKDKTILWKQSTAIRAGDTV